MPTDPDEIWKPGYAGPAPTAPPVVDSGATTRGTEAPSIRDERGRDREPIQAHGGSTARRLGAVAMVTIVIGVGLVVARSSDPELAGSVQPVDDVEEERDGLGDGVEAAAPSTFGFVANTRLAETAAESRRVPERVDEVWRVPLVPTPDDGSAVGSELVAVVEPIDDRYVAVVSGSAGLGLRRASTLALLDRSDGRTLWVTEIGVGAQSGVAVLGATDETLLIQNPSWTDQVAGFDIDTGDERWTIAETDDRIDAVGLAVGYELLPGTPLLARHSNSARYPTVLFDPDTGDEVGRLEGELIGTDGVSTYFTDEGDAIGSAYLPVGASLIQSFPLSERGDQLKIAHEIVFILREGELLVGLHPGADFESVFVAEVADSPALPAIVAALDEMAGSMVLISGSGMVVGAELVGTSIELVWSRAGIATQTVRTEDGTLILVSSDGGATQSVVDGRDGSTITTLTMTPGLFDSLTFADNGFLTRRTSADGPRQAALDLDGNEIWSLPGDDPVVVGDGIVVRVESDSDGAYVVAYGDSTTPP